MIPTFLLTAIAVATPVEDLAWMSGTWRGGDHGMVMEETWSEPAGGTMIGSFRAVDKTTPVFYELMVIEQRGDTPTMLLKHFDPGLVGWEKRKQALTFVLVDHNPGTWALFEDEAAEESLRYTLEDGHLEVELRNEHGRQFFELESWPAATQPQHAAAGTPAQAQATPVAPAPTGASPLLGLRTLGFEVDELDAAKTWFAKALGVQPYFDQPFYVGFELHGSELGLMPRESADRYGPGGLAYWRVADIQAVHAQLIAAGATEDHAIQDVGDGVLISVVATPHGNLLGLVQQPAAY